MAENKAETKAETKKTTKIPEATERRFRVPAGVVRLQKRMLEGQRSLFDTGYNAWSAFREGQENAFHGFLDSTSIVPDELKEIAQAWTDVSRQSREEYKETVDKSFALMEKWYDGLTAEGEAQA